MNPLDRQIEVTKMLEETASVTGELYRRYSERFRDQKALWSNLSSAKTELVGLIRSLRSKIYEGKVNFKGVRFDRRAIQTFIQYVNGLFASDSGKVSSMKNALEAASYLEWVLMGQRFLKTWSKDPEELKQVLKRLAATNKEAREKLVKTMREARTSLAGVSFEISGNKPTAGWTFPGTYTGVTHLGSYPYG